MRISYHNQPGYLHVVYSGTYDLDVLVQSFETIFMTLSATGVSRVLNEYHLTTAAAASHRVMAATELADTAARYERKGMSMPVTYAIYGAEILSNVYHPFLEYLAGYQHLVRCEFLTEEEALIDWITISSLLTSGDTAGCGA